MTTTFLWRAGARALVLAACALAGCAAVPGLLPGMGKAPATPQICDGLRNTATTGAMGDRRSQENAVADMRKRGCPDIPML